MARIVIIVCMILIVVLVAYGVWSFFTQPNENATPRQLAPKILTVAMFQEGDPLDPKS
jgi:hypothetical protein